MAKCPKGIPIGKSVLDKPFWEELRKEIVPMFRKHVWKDGLDINSNPFPDHPPGYQAYKDANAAGRFKGTQVPGFTGQLHNSFGVVKTTDGSLMFGTVTMSGRVNKLTKGIGGRQREITNTEKVVPDHIGVRIAEMVCEYVEKKKNDIADQFTNKQFIIKL